MWRYPSLHVLIASPATPEQCRKIYGPAVQRLLVCDCEQVYVAERDLCHYDDSPLLSPSARPTPATISVDPLLQ
jgi:hypothetical protein